MTTTYGVFPRSDGPGSPPEPATPTPAHLVLVYRHSLDCLDTTPKLFSFSEVVDISPTLVICEMDRDYIAPGQNEVYLDKAQASEVPVQTTLSGLLEDYRTRISNGEAEFGNTPDLSILDGLDLSSYPEIVEQYRESYRAIFFTHNPFFPPFWHAFNQREWKLDIIQQLEQLYDDSDSDFHKLDRWYFHAIACLAIPVLETMV